MAQALPYIMAGTSIASTYSAIKNKPKIQKPQEQADPNSLLNKRKKERSLAARYSGGREDSQLSASNTLG